MKKYLLLVIAILLLVGCSEDNKDSEVEQATNEETTNETVEEEIETVSVDEEETAEDETEEVVQSEAEDKGPLSVVGDKINDPNIGGTVELMGIKEVNESTELGPVNLTIKSIKLIRMADVTNADFLYMIREFTDKETFDYVQIMYEIENTEDINVRLNSPIEAIVLNTGEQIETFGNDMAFDDNFAKTLYGKVKNESMVSIVIKDSEAESINEIKIVTGRIDHADTFETLAEEQSLTYEIE